VGAFSFSEVEMPRLPRRLLASCALKRGILRLRFKCSAGAFSPASLMPRPSATLAEPKELALAAM